MQRTELSLASKLDNGLTHYLCLLLGCLLSATIWLLGLLCLGSQLPQVFEYGEGLADISWHEWTFMLLFGLLLWRHIRYCRYFATGFWHGLNRLLMFQGRLAGVALGVLGFLIGFEPLLETPLEPLNAISDPTIELAGFGLVLLVLYLAAPTAAAGSRPNTMSPSEPAPTTEKEVTE